MGRTSFNPVGKNAETLVVEFLRRTNKVKVSDWMFDQCAQYWSQRGVLKKRDTYSRAFRRMRERGVIGSVMGKVVRRPDSITIVKCRHDRNVYGGDYQYNWNHHFKKHYSN